MPLALLSHGEKAEVVMMLSTINPGGPGSGRDCRQAVRSGGDCRVEEMGIRPGKTVEVLSLSGPGPILVKVDESRIALGRGMAMKIIVRRKD